MKTITFTGTIEVPDDFSPSESLDVDSEVLFELEAAVMFYRSHNDSLCKEYDVDGMTWILEKLKMECTYNG